jgi:hypothetical protein
VRAEIQAAVADSDEEDRDDMDFGSDEDDKSDFSDDI